MSFSLNGGLLAMEEIDNGEDLGEVEAAEVATTVADESAEIQNDNTDIGIEVGKVEDAVQAGEELESLGELAADSLENGEGLSEETAEAVSIAVESILNRLGASRQTRTVPVAESFGNSSSRRVSTKLVVEGIGDWLKKVWASIKAASIRLWDKVRLFLANIFKSGKSLVNHLSALRKRLNEVPAGYVKKKKKIKAKSLATAIAMGKVADLSTFEKNLESASKLSSLSKAVSQHITKIIDTAASIRNVGDFNEATLNAFVKSSGDANLAIIKAVDDAYGTAATMSEAQLNGASVKGLKTEAGVEHKVYGPYPGSSALVVTITERDTGTPNATRGLNIRFQGVGRKGPTVVTALDKGEIMKVIEESMKAANALTDFQATQKNLEKMAKDQQKVADNVLKEVSKIVSKTGSSSETRLGLKEMQEAVRSSLTVLNTFGNNAPSMQFRAVRAGADYASICLRNLGPAGSEGEDDTDEE